MVKKEKKEEGLAWLEESFDKEQEEKKKELTKEEPIVEEEIEPVEEEVPNNKPQEEETSEPINKTDEIEPTDVAVYESVIKKLQNYLLDKDFISSEKLDFPTAKRIHDIINLLLENDGDWIEGTKTMDGFVIQCPIHGYAPMYLCYEGKDGKGCPTWNGNKNAEGVCTRDPEDKDFKAEKYDYYKAQAMEIKRRQDRGKPDDQE